MLDYHIHTSRCGHAEGLIEDYVEKAVEKGIEEIGFSDHFPMDILGFSAETICSMNFEELEDYLEDIDTLNSKNKKRINIKTGVEMDYQSSIEEKLKEFTGDSRWDYIIGSVHFIDGYDFSKPGQDDFFNHNSIDDLYLKYFEKVKNLAKSGIFDIIAHIDLIKKYGKKPGKISLEEVYGEVARVVSDSDMVVEINTAGLRHPVGEIYPSDELMKKLVEKGVPFTLGSDAHRPEDIGFGFRTIKEKLEKHKVESLVGFQKREPFYQSF